LRAARRRVAPVGNHRQRDGANDERATGTDEVLGLCEGRKPLKSGTLDAAAG